ncbi:MAG: type II toxin-antitoxin system VapC family toxin [Deltaproteobacteria bacterium]|nr:type II toxin-antitoxin system VapC family toxin [Deltaproteobacteria bacterium]
MRILLDTNAYSALRRGHPVVAERVRRAQKLFLSVVVIGELQYGFRQGSRCEENLRDLEAFLDHPYVQILQVTLTTADRFGRLAATLRRKGRAVPSNDLWIAAQAMETGAELMTFDSHFQAIDGLALVALPKP